MVKKRVLWTGMKLATYKELWFGGILLPIDISLHCHLVQTWTEKTLSNIKTFFVDSFSQVSYAMGRWYNSGGLLSKKCMRASRPP